MKNKNIDLILLISVIAISIFGIIMIYSSSNIWAEYKFNDAFKYLKMQGLFLIVGIVLMIIISKIEVEIQNLDTSNIDKKQNNKKLKVSISLRIDVSSNSISATPILYLNVAATTSHVLCLCHKETPKK